MLSEVQRLAVTLGVPGDVGYSCETAEYFYREHVLPRMQLFRQATGKGNVADVFPFKEFFNDVLDTVFTGIYDHQYSIPLLRTLSLMLIHFIVLDH